MVLALVAIFFVISGACGLMYETVWMKQVSYVFGNTVTASTVVLGTFMGGLALGSWLPGARIDRLRRPLHVYGWLEIGIAASSTAFAPALAGVRYLDRAVLVPAGVSGPALFAFEMLAVSLLLLVPCALMGATLPVLCRFALPRLDNPGRTLGILYAANSAGAVVGGLLAGFWMIEALGLPATVRIAQALNILVGLAAFTLDRLLPSVPVPVPVPAPAAAAAPAPGHVSTSIIHTHVFLCGFAAMLFEIALMKLLPLIVGSSTQSFSLMICAFITGIAGGSALFGASFARRPARPSTMGGLMLLVGLLFMLSIPLYNHLPEAYVAVRSWARVPYAVFQAIGFGICFAVMFLPTLFLGGVLPAATELVARRDTIGRDVGRLYAANTIGNILGTVATGLVLVPGIGFKRTMEVGVALNVLSGLALCWRDPALAPAWRITGTAAVAGLVAGYALLYPELDVNALTAGVFRHGAAGGSLRELVAKRTLIYQREDGVCFVTVTDTPGVGRALRVNGKADASSGVDMRNQKLAGHFPMLFHPAPRNVLVIGLGSGVTVAAVLKHGPRSVVCPELSPAVIEAARLFAPWNDRVHDDPRARLLVDDGRNFVERSREQFDVIVSEPSNPWIAGIGSLYTVEFFRTVRERLAPGGVMAQFLQLYDMDTNTFRLVLRTVRTVFPHVLVMKIMGVDSLIVASMDPIPVDLDLLERRVQRPGVRADLESVGVRSLMTLAGHHYIPAEHTWEVAGHGPVNRDEEPILEYIAPRVMFERAKATLDVSRFRAGSPYHLLTRYARERGLKLDETLDFLEEMQHDYSLDELTGLLHDALTTGADSARAHSLLGQLYEGGGRRAAALAEFQRASRLEPSAPEHVRRALDLTARIELDDISFVRRRAVPATLELARRLAALAPGDPTAHERKAYAHLVQEQWAEAEAAYLTAIQAVGAGASAERLRGYVLNAALARLERGDPRGAAAYLEQLAPMGPALTPADVELELKIGRRIRAPR